MLRTCLSNDIIVHDFSFNYFCKHCIHCICYCSKFCTLTLNLYIFERRNKINQTNKQIGFEVRTSLLRDHCSSPEPTCLTHTSMYMYRMPIEYNSFAQNSFSVSSFLGPHSFGGVQISPPHEHRILYDTNIQRPWYEAYQPVSYKLVSRRGNRAEFIDMVQRCNNAGVRIYVDAVVNHMCGGDAGKSSIHWHHYSAHPLPPHPPPPFFLATHWEVQNSFHWSLVKLRCWRDNSDVCGRNWHQAKYYFSSVSKSSMASICFRYIGSERERGKKCLEARPPLPKLQNNILFYHQNDCMSNVCDVCVLLQGLVKAMATAPMTPTHTPLPKCPTISVTSMFLRDMSNVPPVDPLTHTTVHKSWVHSIFHFHAHHMPPFVDQIV